MITKNKLKLDAYMELTKKWAPFLLKDIFMGAKNFKDFLQRNEGLSNRVLSDQLKGLEKHGYIKKEIISITPIKIEYSLTELGRSLNKVLYEQCIFAINVGFVKREDSCFKDIDLKEVFGIIK